jgi:hypothetical protein
MDHCDPNSLPSSVSALPCQSHTLSGKESIPRPRFHILLVFALAFPFSDQSENLTLALFGLQYVGVSTRCGWLVGRQCLCLRWNAFGKETAFSFSVYLMHMLLEINVDRWFWEALTLV